MNKELLNTIVVKSSIERYISNGFKLQEIKNKLEDIHLIIVTNEELLDFIFTNMDNKYYKQILETFIKGRNLN